MKSYRNIGKPLLALLLAAMAIAGLLQGCSSGDAANNTSVAKIELTVSAAASLADAVKEIDASFTAQHPNVTLTHNFGGSGKLAAQIEQGAPVDVFLSASKKDMDTLDEKKLIQSRKEIVGNELVLVAQKESPLSYSDFTRLNPEQVKQIAIGNPDTVPAGRYAREVFQKLNLWDKLEQKLVFASDVRQVLTYVETGNAELGVVYATDARSSDKVKVLATADHAWHQPIVYPGAVVTGSKHPEVAQAYLDYLQSEQAKAVFQKYGFITR